MKNINLLLLAITTVLLFACGDDNNAELGEPLSKVVGINDSWELVEVLQVDELQSFNNTRDVSQVIIGDNPAVISFNSSAMTYSIDPGSSRVYIPENGTWAFDNNDFPSQIQLTDGVNDALLLLQASVREQVDNRLIYKYYREPCLPVEGAGAVSYLFTFERQ